MAYEQVAGPIGPARGDAQAAIVASTVANANRGKKSRRFSPADFIPKWDRRAGMSWQEQLAKVKAINHEMGGVDNTREGAGSGDPVEPAGPDRRRRGRRPARRHAGGV